MHAVIQQRFTRTFAVPSLSLPSKGDRYVVLFKDEYSGYRHVYFVVSRDQVFEQLRKCIAAYRDELVHQLSCLDADNGSEITSHRAQGLLLLNGIYRSTAALFTPA